MGNCISKNSVSDIKTRQPRSDTNNHVMISYNWEDSQEVAHKVCDRLRGMGYTVWIDRDQMLGKLYHKMAYAVENANVVLIFMSPKYETSENCESEASYAKQLKKQIIPVFTRKGYTPKGMYGLLAAGKIYIDFSNGSFDNNFRELAKQLGDLVQHDVSKHDVTKQESRKVPQTPDKTRRPQQPENTERQLSSPTYTNPVKESVPAVRHPNETKKSSPEDDVSLDDYKCIFCGEKDDAFNEYGLDDHYWADCPMLKQCKHCNQIVEISDQNQHLLANCENKAKFERCPRCTEAIQKNKLWKHISDKTCTVTNSRIQDHCPLCHRNISQGEESWKNHLMSNKRDACVQNPRRLPSINRLSGKGKH